MKLRPILLLTINENLIIAGVLPIAAPGVAYTATLTGRGGIEPYLWFLDSGTFPTGITGTTDSNNDFVISGTSNDLGPHTFTILLIDSEGRSATRTFTLLVQPLPLTITGNAPNAEKDAPYSYTYNIDGGIPPYYAYIIIGAGSGPIPTGLSFSLDSNLDLVLSGTPTVATLGMTFTIGVNDSQSPAAQAFVTNTISVGAPPLVVTGAFANTTPGNPLSGSPLAISGGIAPYGISGSPYSGTRPTGVTFSIVGSTLVASGNVAAGSYSWTERITSSDGQHFDVVSSVVSAYATLSVSGAFTATDMGDPLQGSPLTITGGLAPYSLSGSPYSGTRPAGVTISISGSTVVATGNTTTAATYTWTERVLSSDGQHYDVACSVVVSLAGDPYWSNVVALARGNTQGTTTTPDETGKTWTSLTTTISASGGKFNNCLVGGGQYGSELQTPNVSDFDFGSGDFTVEFWLNITSFTASTFTGLVLKDQIGGTRGWLAYLVNSTNKVVFYIETGAGGTSLTDTSAIGTGTWVNFAIVRDSGTLRMYRDGVQVSSASITGTANVAPEPCVMLALWGVGTKSFGTGLNGYMDEVRITKGVCRYPSGTTFTPQTAEWLNY